MAALVTPAATRVLSGGSVLRTAWEWPDNPACDGELAGWLDNLELTRLQAAMLEHSRHWRGHRLRFLRNVGDSWIFADDVRLTRPELIRLLDGESPAAVLFGPLQIVPKQEQP